MLVADALRHAACQHTQLAHAAHTVDLGLDMSPVHRAGAPELRMEPLPRQTPGGGTQHTSAFCLKGPAAAVPSCRLQGPLLERSDRGATPTTAG